MATNPSYPRVEKFLNSISYVYPERAAPVTLTKAAGAWAAYPAVADIAAAAVITSDFVIKGVVFDTPSAAGSYTVRLYSGAAGSEVLVAVAAAVSTASGTSEGYAYCSTPVIPGNSRISASLSGSPAGAETVNVKIIYSLV